MSNACEKKRWKAMVEMNFFSVPGLSIYEKMIYTLLCGFADADGASFPSAEKLASLAGCSARQVQRATAALEKKGIITKEARYNERGEQSSNLYRIVASAGAAPEQKAEPEAKPGQGQKILPAAATEGRERCDRLSYKQTQNNKNNNTAALQLEHGSGEAAGSACVSIPVSEAPSALRLAAEYLLLKTGRAGLTAGELLSLMRLEARHVPARIMAETAAAAERFAKAGKKLAHLTFTYIERALSAQRTRGKAASFPRGLTSGGASGPRPKRLGFSSGGGVLPAVSRENAFPEPVFREPDNITDPYCLHGELYAC